MAGAERKNFVLVHGAWHGGWVWRDVLTRLREVGHTATAPTLTGLGERRHVGNDSADLQTHVEDVVAHVEMEDLRDITLVGWSYGGMVATGVLACIPERIKALVYLDAFVPEDGKAVADYWPPEVKAVMDTYRDANAPLPSMPLAAFGVKDPEVAKFVEPRLTAQPWRTCYQPVKALKTRPAIPISYIVCTGWGETPFTARLAEMTKDPDVRTATLDADHLCMLTSLEATISLIGGVPRRDDPASDPTQSGADVEMAAMAWPASI
jgi:pimeloyl-ACP methyl ester carboxylesterase